MLWKSLLLQSYNYSYDSAEGFIAGGTAGVVVETALYPIDTIKTRLQVYQFKSTVCCITKELSMS